MTENSVAILHMCKVLSVTDDMAGQRIQVRLPKEDCSIKDDVDLPYCFPLLPKMFYCMPKVNEAVIVITYNDSTNLRHYIGPIISQQYAMRFDPFHYQSRVFLGTDNVATPLPNPKNDPENEGSCPGPDDVAVQGRTNTDIILKDNDVRIRCGFKKTPIGPAKNTLHFNRTDLSYILMRYRKSKDHKGKEYSSSVNIVADRINLLSHDSKNLFTLNDRKDLISDEEMKKILKEAHPLVYGDELIEFLMKFIQKVFKTHTHPFAQDPPIFDSSQEAILNTDLNSMLSQSVRTN